MNLRTLIVMTCLAVCWGCQNIEDAKPAARNTFIHFYEAAHTLTGVSAEATDEGYVILGNETLANGNQNIVFIMTDKNGQRRAPDVILEGGYANALKVTPDGYYIIGDSIKLNLQSTDVTTSDLVVYSARLFKLSTSGTLVKRVVMADRKDTTNITDIHGGSITVNDQQEVIVLGTFKPVTTSANEQPYLIAFHETTLDTLWYKRYDIMDRDYVNSKSMHISPTGKIIWATALLKDNQNFSRSYMGVPYLKENSTFENFSEFGELTDQQLYPNDIQPAASAAFGYGVIGTYASPTGANGNIFFIRVDQYGNITPGSERYFDGETLGGSNTASAADQAGSDDTGDAIIATQDGGFILAGAMLTTPQRGKGGKDILLIKVDNQGNVLWNKILGGAGDETVSSVRETSDGGLLLCGTNTVSGLASVFMMKTDMNGELKD